MMSVASSYSFPAAHPQWQSGYLSYATAQLVSEFSAVDPAYVIDAFATAIEQIRGGEGGGSLLQRAREILEDRMRKTV